MSNVEKDKYINFNEYDTDINPSKVIFSNSNKATYDNKIVITIMKGIPSVLKYNYIINKNLSKDKRVNNKRLQKNSLNVTLHLDGRSNLTNKDSKTIWTQVVDVAIH